jgi:NADPH:quinone reductase-like Zn-dependent oxidoreductase
MRILVAGASGVLGRATLPHLEQHEVVGLTRTDAKRELVRELGAEAVVGDVYDYPALLTIVARARPQTVVNFLTDLRAGSEANNQIRREGASNVFAAAERAGAARLIVESVAFPLEGDAARALDDLERSTFMFAGEALILRFGRLWDPKRCTKPHPRHRRYTSRRRARKPRGSSPTRRPEPTSLPRPAERPRSRSSRGLS